MDVEKYIYYSDKMIPFFFSYKRQNIQINSLGFYWEKKCTL